MGFSVSASTAVVFIAAFISVGFLYSAAYNGYEQVNDAEQLEQDKVLDRHNTEIRIANTTYNDTSDELTVQVDNEGATALEVNATDVLVDGEYAATWQSWNVTGQTDTDLWLPGETLNVTVDTTTLETTNVTRVKVVSGPGVAAEVVV